MFELKMEISFRKLIVEIRKISLNLNFAILLLNYKLLRISYTYFEDIIYIILIKIHKLEPKIQ